MSYHCGAFSRRIFARIDRALRPVASSPPNDLFYSSLKYIPILARSRRFIQDASHNSQAADNGVVSDGLGLRSLFLCLRKHRVSSVQDIPEIEDQPSSMDFSSKLKPNFSSREFDSCQFDSFFKFSQLDVLTII